jgi:hypothetical protein
MFGSFVGYFYGIESERKNLEELKEVFDKENAIKNKDEENDKLSHVSSES